ncbi:MAG: hypothetical protein QM652_05455 [Legionella sp.]|uniref:hypothetical protein n=1 Tax=Legionella sp. TaxID=459 RepID=UPI0039E4FF13
MDEHYKKIKSMVDEFKELHLSKQVNHIRYNLTLLITNPDIMSDQITVKMVPPLKGRAYHIDSSDPEQVVLVKKVINILLNIEKILQDLETINLSETTSPKELIAHAPKIARNLYRAVKQVYEMFDLINNSNVSAQVLFGPYVNQLKQNISPLIAKLSQFTPNRIVIEQNWGQVLGQMFNLLPKERITPEQGSFNLLGQAVFNIPEYFKQLQMLLETGALLPEPEQPLDPRLLKQKEARKEDAKAFAANLDSLAAKTWMQGLGIEYVAAVGRLTGFMKEHTKSIVQIGIATSKTANARLEEALLHFKLEILPAIIDELEALEVTLGLKPGFLVEPALDAANQYYNKLIETLNTKIEEARVKTNKNLVKAFLFVTEDNQNKLELDSEFKIRGKIAYLFDDAFKEQREKRQIARLDTAKKQMHEVQNVAKAAELFFTKINARPKNLTLKDRQELAFLYQQFQSYMVVRDPQLDKAIVGYLNLTEKEKELWRRPKTAVERPVRLAVKSLFDKILIQRASVTDAINREITSITTQIELSKTSQIRAKESMYVRTGKKTSISPVSDRCLSLAQLSVDEHLPFERLNKEISTLSDELASLEQAKVEFTAFMSMLTEVAKEHQLLSSANEEEKEYLRKHYAQFQKYIGLKEDESLNQLDKQLVIALMSDKPKREEELAIADLLARRENISDNMLNIQENIAAKKVFYLQYLQAKSEERPMDPIILKPSSNVSKGTLLTQARVYKTSAKIDDSLQKAIEFLQKNLATGVAEELHYDASSPKPFYLINESDSIESILYKTLFNYVYRVIDNALQKAIGFLKNNLSTEMLKTLHLNQESSVKVFRPYQLNASDSNQAALYKNAINALYYLRESFVVLEEQNEYQYTKNIFSRAYFFGKTTLAVSSSATNMINALRNVSNNPQFAALVKILPKELAEFFEQAKVMTAEKVSEAVAKAKVDPRFAVMLQNMPEEVTEYLEHTDDPCLIPKVIDWLEYKLFNFFENTPLEEMDARFNEFEQGFILFLQDLESQGLAKTLATEKILDALHQINVQIKVKLAKVDGLHGKQGNISKGQERENQDIDSLQELAQVGLYYIRELKGIRKALTANLIAQTDSSQEMIVEKSDEMKQKETLQKVIEGIKKLPALAQDKENFVVALEGMILPLSNIGVTPEKLQKLFRSVQALYAALINVSVGSRELIVEKLKSVQSEVASIILLTDDAECALGLKPGVLSSTLTKQFESFLEKLVTSMQMPLSNQEILTLVTDNNIISKRIIHEQERVQALQETASKMTPVRQMEIRIAQERVDYLTELKKEKEATNTRKFEQFKQETYEKILEQEIRPLVTPKMGVYAKQFFQDIKQLLDERKESILSSIGQDTLIEQTIRDRLNSLLVEVMNPSITQGENFVQQVKKLYEQTTIDLKVIEEVKKQIQGKKTNSLIQEILTKFEAFEKEVQAFENKDFSRSGEAEKRAYMEQLQEHVAFVRSFRDKLGNYQLLTNKDNLSNYAQLQGEKEKLLAKSPKEMNAGMHQKITYLNTYEKQLVDKCEHSNRHQVANEINAFVKTLNLYDALVAVCANSKKLMAQIDEDIAKLSKPEDSCKLAMKKRQRAVIIDNLTAIIAMEMPIKDKIKQLNQFIVNDSESNSEIYKDGFGKLMHENSSMLTQSTESKKRKYAFFSNHHSGSYVRNVTPDLLLPKIEKKLAELEQKNGKSDHHKREVLKAAHHMLREGTGSKEELVEVMRRYPDYDASIGPSKVKTLVHQAMECLEMQTKRIGLG